MAILKLYGVPHSTCSKRVATILIEKRVQFEFIVVDFSKKEHKSEAYLEKQPFGQVPYIDDDGFILYESRAIARYIATKYADQGTKLIPAGLKEQALFEQAVSIESSNFDPYASRIAYERIIKPRYGGVTDSAVVELQLQKLNANLDVYDRILSKQKYLAGDEPTLADLFHLPYGAYVLNGGDLLQNRPNVARWWNELTARQSWKDLANGISQSSA